MSEEHPPIDLAPAQAQTTLMISRTTLARPYNGRQKTFYYQWYLNRGDGWLRLGVTDLKNDFRVRLQFIDRQEAIDWLRDMRAGRQFYGARLSDEEFFLITREDNG